MKKTLREMLTDGSLEDEIIRQALDEDADPDTLRNALKIVNEMKKSLGIGPSIAKTNGGPITVRIIR